MTIAEQIYQEARTLPHELAREALNFTGFIAFKQGLKPATKKTVSDQLHKPLRRTPGTAS